MISVRKTIRCLLGFLLIALQISAFAIASDVQKTVWQQATPVYTAHIVERYHQIQPVFVQGLVLLNHKLYISSGLYERSFLSISNIHTASLIKKIKMKPSVFAEGLTLFQHRLYQLFWRSQKGLIYNPKTLNKVGSFAYLGEGWGLTHDQHDLIMSNGSATLQFIDPHQHFKLVKKLVVRDNAKTIARLNALFYYNHQIFANIWHQPRIAIINANSGSVRAWIDLSKLIPTQKMSRDCRVANGITINPKTHHLIVTGKCWQYLYEIRYKN